MAGLRQGANIFKVVETMKDAWASIERFDTSGFSAEELEAYVASQKRFLFDGADVRQSLTNELEDFVFSCKWTDSDVVKEIVGYIRSGFPLSQIGDLVGLKNSAFRMRVIRLTDHINELLFDGQNCPECIYSLTDLGAMKKTLVKLRLIRDPIKINEEFSLKQLDLFKEHTAGVGDPKVGPENLEKYYKSVLFLALTSRSFTQTLLDEVDPPSLECAYKDMQANGINSTKLLFSLLLRRLTSASVACKDELAIVKREYQDIMRS